MKKNTFLLFLILLFCSFFSCSSDDSLLVPLKSEEILYDVVFDIEGFQEEISPLRSSIGKYATYSVYAEDSMSSTGAEVLTYSTVVIEKALAPDVFFNKIDVKLPKGRYKIVIFVSDGVIGNFVHAESVFGDNLNGYLASGAMYQDLTKDLFRGEINFSVGDKSIVQKLILKRPISKISLAIGDLNKMPPQVKTIIPVIYNVVGSTVILVQPLHIFLNGVTQFYGEWSILDGSILAYEKIAISKKDIYLYNKVNPITFNFPQNQDYRFIEGSSHGTHDLYLLGLADENITVESLKPSNSNIIYSKLLRKEIQLMPNQSVTLFGNIFDNTEIRMLDKIN